MLVSATASIAKSIRDTEKSMGLHTKLDEARTERLLMEINTARD